MKKAKIISVFNNSILKLIYFFKTIDGKYFKNNVINIGLRMV